MKPGEWYKTFGTSTTPRGEIHTYYHIIDIIDDEKLHVDSYEYYILTKRLIKTSSKRVEFPFKWWLEQIIQNNIHPVPREELPFLLTF
ncbi:MAG: hypothetical protein AB1798_08175 [Spirochaetota bacterium]